MVQPEKKIISVLDTELYYEVYGEGVPMLLLHGWGVDHRILTGCMEPFFKGKDYNIQRIYIDLPGMGNSAAGPWVKRSDDVLKVILAFLDAVIPNRPFVLVGQSYGGYLARALMKARREQILGMLLVCPLVYPGYRKGMVPPLTILEKDETFLAALSEDQRKSFEYITVRLTKPVWERYEADIYDAVMKQRNSDFLNHVLDGEFSYDVDDLNGTFDKPGLLLAGREDTEVGYSDQLKLLESYPRTTFALLDKAGHNLQIEQPELFNSLVAEWLERVISELAL